MAPTHPRDTELEDTLFQLNFLQNELKKVAIVINGIPLKEFLPYAQVSEPRYVMAILRCEKCHDPIEVDIMSDDIKLVIKRGENERP